MLNPLLRRSGYCVAVLVLALIAGACGGGDDEGTAQRSDGGADAATASAAPKLRLVTVGQFNEPLHALAVPGTDQIAVVQKGGQVIVASNMTCAARDNCPERPVRAGTTVLDIAARVSTSSEQGLLGFAFHPEWPSDPRVFVNYTDLDGDTHVEAWSMATPTSRAVRERELLRIDQPFENHNGGHLAFGPDGLLYIGTGDGGSGGDPGNRAQSPDELLGKILRLDVDQGGERGYAIPDGNFAAESPVWALGLRNPWRFSFDSETGAMWIGDVGQNELEEINAIESATVTDGGTPNFQWRRREGFANFSSDGVRGPGVWTAPIADYGRDKGCSITGGVVYRGTGIPALRGWYVFADFCGADLRLLRAPAKLGSGTVEDEPAWVSQRGAEQIASFGTTARGELLVVSLSGTISQVVATS